MTLIESKKTTLMILINLMKKVIVSEDESNEGHCRRRQILLQNEEFETESRCRTGNRSQIRRSNCHSKQIFLMMLVTNLIEDFYERCRSSQIKNLDYEALSRSTMLKQQRRRWMYDVNLLLRYHHNSRKKKREHSNEKGRKNFYSIFFK